MDQLTMNGSLDQLTEVQYKNILKASKKDTSTKTQNNDVSSDVNKKYFEFNGEIKSDQYVAGDKTEQSKFANNTYKLNNSPLINQKEQLDHANDITVEKHDQMIRHIFKQKLEEAKRGAQMSENGHAAAARGMGLESYQIIAPNGKPATVVVGFDEYNSKNPEKMLDDVYQAIRIARTELTPSASDYVQIGNARIREFKARMQIAREEANAEYIKEHNLIDQIPQLDLSKMQNERIAESYKNMNQVNGEMNFGSTIKGYDVNAVDSESVKTNAVNKDVVVVTNPGNKIVAQVMSEE